MNRPEINVTPLIDVLLVLLIIFMVVAPIRPSAFNARIPSGPSADPHVRPDPDTLVVASGQNSELSLNNEKLDATIENTDVLVQRLSGVFASRKANLNNQRTVFVKAPRSLSYGDVAKIIDALKAAGADPISLQIDTLE